MQHTADQCAKCRAILGVGRFCTNCGHPRGMPVLDDLEIAAHVDDDWRTGTAERPAVPPDPVEPPPAHEPVAAPRYPLYADQAAPTDETLTELPVMPAAAPAPSGGSHRADDGDRRRAGWVPWLVGLAGLALVATLGVVLLLTGDDDGTTSAADPGPDAPSQTTDAGTPDDATDDPDDEPDADPDEEGSGEPRNVARFATATAPETAPPSRDNAGNAVRYEARQMLDGVAETTWRMRGDGTGETLTFELDSPTTLSSLGIVNGYAKTGRDGEETFDWYAGNRRVLVVEWIVDGTTIRQELAETRELQTIEVDQVTTDTVELRLVEVSSPGEGRASRDYTAISEIALVGVPT